MTTIKLKVYKWTMFNESWKKSKTVKKADKIGFDAIFSDMSKT